MAKSSTSHKSAHCPHSAVKWPHWVREKIDHEILGFFEQILLYECTKAMKCKGNFKKFCYIAYKVGFPNFSHLSHHVPTQIYT